MQRIRRAPGAGSPLKPYLFLLPMLLTAGVFVYWPFARNIVQSFSQVNFRGQITGFSGLNNYRYLFSRREFGIAIRNTLRLMLINVPVTVLLTVSLAWFCTRRTFLSPLYETMLALPMTVSMAAVTLIFRVLLNPSVGYVNYVLGLDIGWYTDRHTAMYGILLLTVWMGIGFNFVLLLSAFRGIPEDLIGSARLEGAGTAVILFRLQLPMISPTLLYVVCTNMIQAMMTNGPILILTQGGPSRSTTTLIYLMYSMGYGSSDYGVASAISIVAFGMTLLFSVCLLMLEGKRVHYR
ncbi:MAG: sugar ABC transporter permease [Clostridia bacterium]|nr:sugar ABC transporter permease [Clostridia bacterium]